MTDPIFDPQNTLETCLEAIYDRGQSAADCLARYPEQREALEPLLNLTERLRAARQLTPSPDFQMAARARLEQRLAGSLRASTAAAAYAEPASASPASPAPAVETPHHPTSPWPTRAPHSRPAAVRQPAARAAARPIWAFAAVLLLALIFLVVNTTVSRASRALPGDPFFPVKIAAENAQRALAPSAAQDAGLEITFADQRFAEVKTALTTGETRQAVQAAGNYTQQLQTAYTYTGSSLLTADQQAQVAARLADVLARHEKDITALASAALAGGAPAEVQAEISGLVNTLHELYINLYKRYPNLPPPSQPLIALPTFTAAPRLGEITATPSPRPTEAQTVSTPVQPQPAGPEWPTTWPSAWPTQWTTEWATLLPTGYVTEIPPILQTVIATAWPTYIPTNILDQLPIPTVIPGDPGQWPTFPPGDENWPPDPGSFPQPPDGFVWPPGN